jgi:ATP-binding cassette subfamily B protein
MFVRGTVFILAVLVILFIYSPILTGVTMAGIIPVLVFGVIYGGKMKTLTKLIQEDKAKMSNVADESFGNIRTVKAFSNELEETMKFSKHNLDVFENSKARAVWYGFFVFFVQVLLYGSMSGIIYIAAILYKNGKIDIGTITSFLFYMILLLVNFGIIAGVFGNVMAIFGASDKIVKIIQH